jgi:diaminohydroxyphosphoribosylaminopyrimidine deaminase / 5-amino-6-(5-phosphoribosylamino)uracil reductase
MQPTSTLSFDRHMMAIALRMAKRGLGQTAPNPSVGAVIANENTSEIIARGWTQPGGRPHAEKEALRIAGPRARDQTMYLTLEPCAHTGRVPTCADAMLTAGLSRVVCAIPDPNPVISGSGFEQLRQAGIHVDVGLRAEEARWLTLGHILRQTRHRPFVQLKLAVSADNKIAPGDGQPVWVTGPEARAQGHLMRAEADAILVGIKTIFADDPELTCRLPGLAGRSPDRVIVDNKLRTPPTARALIKSHAKQNIWIAVSAPKTSTPASSTTTHGAIVLHAPNTTTNAAATDHVSLPTLLTTLASQGVTRILVEGGPTIAANLIADDLVDEIVIFKNPKPLGDNGSPVAAINAIDDRTRWHQAAERRLGVDTMTVYHRIDRLITEDFA